MRRKTRKLLWRIFLAADGYTIIGVTCYKVGQESVLWVLREQVGLYDEAIEAVGKLNEAIDESIEELDKLTFTPGDWT